MQGEWRQNLEHKGIEIEFPGTPPAEIRKAMKDNGFRWTGSSGVWYAKDAPDRRAWVAGQDWATAGEAVGAPLSFEERLAVKQARAEARTERLEGYKKVAGVGSQLKGYDNPGFLARRIKEAQAEIRRLERHAKEWEAEKPTRAAYLAHKAAGGVENDPGWDDRFWVLEHVGYTGDPETPSHVAQLAEARGKLDCCQAKLEELGGLGSAKAAQ